jgi:hypothetical protein
LRDCYSAWLGVGVGFGDASGSSSFDITCRLRRLSSPTFPLFTVSPSCFGMFFLLF